jgi:type IV secretory pathway VirB4 component
MLFEADTHFQVVESKTFGLAQHNPYTWLVKDDHLVRANDIYEFRKKMDNTLNEWILSLNEEQLRTFVDTLYQVISASQAENLIEFTAEWKRSMNGIVSALKEVDEDTARALKEMIRSLFEMAGEQMRKDAADRTVSAGKKQGRQNKSKAPRPRSRP